MLQFQLPAMNCDHCVRAITGAVRALDPQAQVSADLASHTVRVETSQPQPAVAAALAEAGYPPA